jgi:hypothetical protein
MAAPTAKLLRYVPSSYPQLGDDSTYLTREFDSVAEAILLLKEAVTALDTVATPLTNAANDAAAAAAGVAIGALYHTAGAVKVRLT